MLNLNNCMVELYDHSGEIAYIVFNPDDQSYETMMKLGRGTPGKVYNGRLCYQYKSASIYAKV